MIKPIVRRIGGMWGATPRGLRWGLGAVLAASLIAFVRLWLLATQSNAPYEEEIQDHFERLATANRDLDSLVASSSQALRDGPGIVRIEKLQDTLGAITRRRNVAEELESCLEFYSKFETERWTEAEKEVLLSLREAPDRVARMYELTLAETDWMLAPARARQVHFVRYGEGGWIFGGDRGPFTGYLAVAMANAEKGDAQAAIEGALRLLEAIGGTPRPWRSDSYSWAAIGVEDLANVIVVASARAGLTAEQFARFEKGWQGFASDEIVHESIRASAAEMIRMSGRRYIGYWGVLVPSTVQHFNLYAYAKDYPAIYAGMADPPFDFFGLAYGQGALESSARSLLSRAEYSAGIAEKMAVMRAMRAYEEATGRLPESMDVLAASLDDPESVQRPWLGRESEHWFFRVSSTWSRDETMVWVEALDGDTAEPTEP